MSLIKANGFRFSNLAELLGLRGGIFPTPEVRSLFKFNHQSHLQSPLLHFLIIYMKTPLIIYGKSPLILLSFSVSEFKKLGLTSSAASLFSNAKFDDRAELYTEKLFNLGNWGTCAHPSITQAFRLFLSLLTLSPVSHLRRPHPLTRRGELAIRTSLFPLDSPKSRPARFTEAFDVVGGDEVRDPALAS